MAIRHPDLIRYLAAVAGVVLALSAAPAVAQAQAPSPTPPPISAADLRMIDDLRLGPLGRDVTLAPAAVQAVGLNTGQVRLVRFDADPAHGHVFERVKDNPTTVLLLYQDRTANAVTVYRLDAGYRFSAGYTMVNGDLRALTAAEGQTGVDGELAWWRATVAAELAKVRKRLLEHASPAEVAEDYGVSADAVKAWVAGAQ